MKFTRRDALAAGLGATAVAMLPLRALAAADEKIAMFTGGAAAGEGNITLTAPEIAENGNTVPISVDAPGAVVIAVFAAGNPNPDVCSFGFGPAAGAQSASTRIRLAGTQDLIAVAKMADGSFIRASRTVKVTIGGCGG
jgi:sulfur-oxidizing protein SoxY